MNCNFSRCVDEARKRGYCYRHYSKLVRTNNLPVTCRVIDPEPIRARIDEHLRRGRHLGTLAKMAGVHAGTLRLVHERHYSHMRPVTARRVMAVPLPPTVIGVRRRLQALARIGYSIRTFTRITEISCSALERGVVHGPLTADMRVRVAEAYERLSAVPYDSPAVVARATKLGYIAPADWEYIDIDDPEASPDRVGSPIVEDVDETAVEMLVAGNHPTVRPPRTAYVGAVAQLTVKGFSGAVIGTRLGITVRTVERMRAEIRGELAAPGQPRKPITHCKGKERHPFTEENARIDKNGRRHCRPCETRYKASQRATVAA